MFENLEAQPGDGILELMGLFRDDPRPGKIDLGVGVYKNAEGVTPIMRAIKTAEKRLWEVEDTKSYVAPTGAPEFLEAMAGLVLGDAIDRDRLSYAATSGGTGAVRSGMDMIGRANPDATVWVSDPTWPVHWAILRQVGQKHRPYRYFDPATRAVDFDAMMADLDGVARGDVVLLHGCCHNPTGANLTLPEWQIVADHLSERGALAFVDIAYQGFGDGLEQDAAGLRLIAASLPEVIIAASCSKNFGIYRERAGCIIAISEPGQSRDLTQGMLSVLNRNSISFPPDHGARLVSMILNDPALRADWQDELEGIRIGMLDLRQSLADALRARAGSDRFGFLADHRGMFSRLGATPEQVQHLRDAFGIYMVADSRMNIAGLNKATIPVLADAIIATGI